MTVCIACKNKERCKGRERRTFESGKKAFEYYKNAPECLDFELDDSLHSFKEVSNEVH